ncbi:MAG: HPr family phosphocarrier protein [Sphingomonadaceae bacterium]|uniref:HPr family phosphocarrier protein n=1 Tax=Thermaurantiacus sp. TaxID=2820283 RepID=UPI00298EE0AF|nr:HPr family phosphocarrier protein [Thermaurantiacus sp.]MCS6986632.1 HPr family phosphocarrier protein [Sphingomonadaceae bacterium]MDW8414107.1 HPr family phosphocarrier protein [Thermaurantiacus sp.]
MPSAGPVVVRIGNRRGLHARASARFVTVASQFAATVTVAHGGHRVLGTSIMGLMMLGAAMGEEITLAAEGEDASAALAALVALVESGFGED